MSNEIFSSKSEFFADLDEEPQRLLSRHYINI